LSRLVAKGFAQKMLQSWKNAQNPHFSSGAETPIFTPELKCAPSAKIEFLCKAVGK
jgi:hypothetical protein